MTPEQYNAKREARIERLENAADNAAQASKDHLSKAHEMASVIPMGQPILVGHHSEKRDRRYRGRIEGHFQKGFEEQERAKELQSRADSARNNDAIFSDDPQAGEKIEEKISRLEARQAEMKRINQVCRKYGLRYDLPDLKAICAKIISDGILSENDMLRAIKASQVWGGQIGFPAYALTNNNANIRRCKQRLSQIQSNSNRQEKRSKCGGIEIVENVDLNRVQMFFPGKPDEKTRDNLKSHGFHWSPMEGAWQRHLTESAVYVAFEVAGSLRARWEQATDTIRSIPENYCLAHRQNGVWSIFELEGATKEYREALGKKLEIYYHNEASLAAHLGSVLLENGWLQKAKAS